MFILINYLTKYFFTDMDHVQPQKDAPKQLYWCAYKVSLGL